MSPPTGWLPGILKSCSESERLYQQANPKQTVHGGCALERTVLIREVIGDDNRGKKGVYRMAVGDCARPGLSAAAFQVPLSPQAKSFVFAAILQAIFSLRAADNGNRSHRLSTWIGAPR